METLRKIAELIEQNKTLEQRNEELKNILEVNLNRSDHDDESSFPEIAYLTDAKTLIVKCYQYNKIPIALFNAKGKLIFSIGWKKEHNASDQNCENIFAEYKEYEQFKSKTSPQKIDYFFKQLNGVHGLALPVEIKNKQVAILMLSQFYCAEKMSAIEKQTRSIRINHESSQIPEIQLISKKQFESINQSASFLAEMISFLGLKNIEGYQKIKKQTSNEILLSALHEKISEQEKIIKSLLYNISVHQAEVKENTISKTDFQIHQKRLIDRLKHAEALLNSLLTSMPLGIGFVKKDVFTYVNDQMFRITGYTAKELIGRDPEILFGSQSEYQEIMNLSPDSFMFKDNKSFETTIVQRDGNLIDAIIFVSMIDYTAPDLGMAFSIMDISAIKKIQRELIQEKERAIESDRLKTAFLNNMSHEFRTPMNAIIGFTELIVSPYFNENQRNEYFKMVQKNGKRLLRLIDDIIDISKLSSNQLQLYQKEFSLHEIMTDLYNTFSEYVSNRHGSKIKLIYKEPENPNNDILFNDDFRIKQVLSNLLSNSLKFTSNGFIEFGYKTNDKLVQFYVKDTGKGIKKQDQEYIFDKFCQGDSSLTREHGGAGLGLSLAKGLTELMGGTIRVNSKWGKGTTLEFTIPLNVDHHQIKRQMFNRQLQNQINDWSKKTILIAEDEELNYRYLQALLMPTHIKIKWVDNGQKAIDVIHNDSGINLILMDIRMPVMNGLDATKVIKSTNKEIPIIAQTAYAQSNEREHYLSAGCDEFIPKPINTSHFISVLEKYLNKN